MLVSEILLLIIFISLLILIATDTLERSMVAIIAAILTYFILIFIEGASPLIIPEFLVGTSDDGFQNLHSIILIFSMMFLVQVANEAGLFQFISFKLIQLTKGRPYFLLAVFCLLAISLTAIINDILTVIILIPLTITVCRILNTNPIPYILTQAIIVRQGATIFMISSIPSIIISNHLGLSFSEFFVYMGLISLGMVGFTILWFMLFYRQKLSLPRKGIDMLLEFKVGNFITNRPLLYKTIVVFIILFISFIVIPPNIIPPDLIALICAAILATISRIDLEKLLHRMDFTMIIYLLGIFVIAGGLEYVGFMGHIARLIGNVGEMDSLSSFLIILWLSAGSSALVDNVPIMKLLLPVVDIVTEGLTPAQAIIPYQALNFGVVWGDNMSPFGDTVLVFTISAQNKVEIKPGQFFRIGFITAFLQLMTLSLGFALILNPPIGLSIFAILIGIGLVFFVLGYLKQKKLSMGKSEIGASSHDKIELNPEDD